MSNYYAQTLQIKSFANTPVLIENNTQSTEINQTTRLNSEQSGFTHERLFTFFFLKIVKIVNLLFFSEVECGNIRARDCKTSSATRYLLLI